jgi:hypothetical protein
MVRPEPGCPLGKGGAQPVQHDQTLGQFHLVPLAVVEADSLDFGKPVEGPGKARGGILAAGEQHEGLGGAVGGQV